MLFFLSFFFLFLYFKIARVHKKEEKQTTQILAQHTLVALSAFSISIYGLSHLLWYVVILVSFVFFIIAALMITAVQLGIFVDGKPQLRISTVYKFLPVLTFIIIVSSAIIWL